MTIGDNSGYETLDVLCHGLTSNNYWPPIGWRWPFGRNSGKWTRKVEAELCALNLGLSAYARTLKMDPEQRWLAASHGKRQCSREHATDDDISSEKSKYLFYLSIFNA